MPEPAVRGCVIVDDVPSNPTYWWRAQQTAFGYDVPVIGFGGPWREQAAAPVLPVEIAHGFADFAEEFDVRGKFTLLPCPAGHGRIDREVRGFARADLDAIVAVVRDRLAPRFDITPEVLTHSMALDVESGALLPHSESAWVSWLAREGRIETLMAYLRHGGTILRNVGIAAHGVTVGGMTDPSGIAAGEMVLFGFHREALCRAVLAVEREFDPATGDSFIYTGSKPVSSESAARQAPECLHTSPDGGRVFALHSMPDDPLIGLLYGGGDESTAADRLVTPDLSAGSLVDEAEAGRAVVITVHSQTLNALNTGRGLKVLREAVRRLRERYGRRLAWHTPRELAALIGV